MKLEYLIHTDSDETFCTTPEEFSKLLELDAKLFVTEDKISLKIENKNCITAQYTISTGLVSGKDERYFLIVLFSDAEDKIDEFHVLGQTVIATAKRINPEKTRINTLWNDVGKFYANLSYPYINDIENLMRKLISQFMLINVGVDWSREALPDKLISKIDRSNSGQAYVDELASLDFIQLSEVLFEKKSDISKENMHRLLAKTTFSEDDKVELKKYIPRSNWEKYFAGILNVNEQLLAKKWLLLYEERNHVAHNRYISKADFKKIKGMCEDVEKILLDTIKKLPEIQLVEEDKVNIKNIIRDTVKTQTAYYAEDFMRGYYAELGLEVSVLYSNRTNAYLIALNTNKRIGVVIKYFAMEREIINPVEIWDEELFDYKVFGKNNDVTHTDFVYIFPPNFILESIYFNRIKFEFQLKLEGRQENDVSIVLGYLDLDSVFHFVKRIENVNT